MEYKNFDLYIESKVGEADLTRVLVALFYSGIFWMMMLFLLEKRSTWRGSLAVATAMLILSACLFLGAVAHEDIWALWPVVP